MTIGSIPPGYAGYNYYRNANGAKNAGKVKPFAEQLLESSSPIPSTTTKKMENVPNVTSHFNIIIPKGEIINSVSYPDGSYDTFQYAKNSTKENPVIIVNSVDKNGNEFEKTIKIKEINLNNTTSMEIRALETHTTISNGGKAGLSKLAPLYHIMETNSQKDVAGLMNKMIDDFMMTKQPEHAKVYADKLRLFLNFLS